jgi:hypothetical protein
VGVLKKQQQVGQKQDKPDSQAAKTLAQQYSIFKDYLLRLCRYDHFLKNPSLKIFVEKKTDLRDTLEAILKQFDTKTGKAEGEEETNGSELTRSEEEKEDQESKKKQMKVKEAEAYLGVLRQYLPNFKVFHGKRNQSTLSTT